MKTDIAALIEPIGGASPCGDDLMFSTDFDAIQDARRFDDPSLDQGEWITEVKEADWGFVIERCTALLRSRTKDLRLAVWLTEALAIKQGAAGLAQGYALLDGLCERYWDNVHPLPDEDDAGDRLGNVAWLVGRTAELLRSVPLTGAPGSVYRMLDWEVATQVAQAVKRDPDHADDIARGKPELEQIEAAKRVTPARFYVSLLADLKAFEAALLKLEAQLDRRAGKAAPSFRQAKEAHEAVLRLATRFARELGVDTEPAAKATPPAEFERAEPEFKTPFKREASASPVMPTGASGIQSRAQAVAQLRAVARFFRSTEPHSPAAYLADKAADWADMPLHRWLTTVVKDDASLAHVRELLGVKSDEAE